MSGPESHHSDLLASSTTARRPLPAAAGALVLAMLLALFPGAPARAQDADEPAEQLLTVESVTVEPAKPSADTLCRLQVEVRNRGIEKASQLDFKVEINGQPLAVYRNQIFMYPIEPGETATVQLYNFWSTETSRPMPADAKLEVEVALVEAQWMSIGDEEGVEVWKPLGAVEGLPSSAGVTVEMSK